MYKICNRLKYIQVHGETAFQAPGYRLNPLVYLELFEYCFSLYFVLQDLCLN